MTDERGSQLPALFAGQLPGGAKLFAPAHACIVPPSPIPGDYGHLHINKSLAKSTGCEFLCTPVVLPIHMGGAAYWMRRTR